LKPAASPVHATQQDEKPPTLLDLFNKDFANTMKASDDGFDLKWSDNTTSHVKPQVDLDFPAKTQFVGFYVSSSTHNYEACLELANAVQQVINSLPKRLKVSGGQLGELTTLEELMFSGRVYLYHDDFLSITQKAAIIEAYKRQNFDVQFRGPDYLGIQVIAWHNQHDAKDVH
jgi:hypothetical protein